MASVGTVLALFVILYTGGQIHRDVNNIGIKNMKPPILALFKNNPHIVKSSFGDAPQKVKSIELKAVMKRKKKITVYVVKSNFKCY